LFPFARPPKLRDPYSKILSYFLAFSACFVILSISVEGLFFVSYSALLVVWVEVEAAIRAPPSPTNQGQGAKGKAVAGKKTKESAAGYQLQADDLRVALFFLFFVQVAFFGTGNVASIS
jgi:phosphatidylinositol glycan class N